MTNKILFIDDVEKITRLSRPTIHKYILTKDFPEPFFIGPRKVWYESELDAWINKQKDQGNNNANTK